MFQTKVNSKSQRAKRFSQIYEKSTSSFVALMPCLVMFFSVKAKFSPIFCLAYNSHIICDCCSVIYSNISWLVNVKSPSHGKLCRVMVYWYKSRSAMWLNIGDFLSNPQCCFIWVPKFWYVYNLYYMQDSKIHKLNEILNNLEFRPLYYNNN